MSSINTATVSGRRSAPPNPDSYYVEKIVADARDSFCCDADHLLHAFFPNLKSENFEPAAVHTSLTTARKTLTHRRKTCVNKDQGPVLHKLSNEACKKIRKALDHTRAPRPRLGDERMQHKALNDAEEKKRGSWNENFVMDSVKVLAMFLTLYLVGRLIVPLISDP